MTRSRLFLLSGALLLGFFLVGSVLAVRLAALAPGPTLVSGTPTLEVSAPGGARSTTPMASGAVNLLVTGASTLRVNTSGAAHVNAGY